MSNPIYQQSPVRVELSPLINPPRGLADYSTGEEPQFWRGTPAALQLGIFNQNNIAVDLANLVALQLTIATGPTALVPLVTKTLLQAELTDTITRAQWLDGTGQQAQFDLTAAEMDLGLNAQPSAEFWMTFTGITASNQTIVYGAGYVRVATPSNYLPSPMPGIVSLNRQENSGGTSVLVPLSLIHTEEITFTGAAGARYVTVQSAGLTNGQPITLIAKFDSEAENGIVVNVRVNTTTGPLLFSFTRNGDEESALFEMVADGAGGFTKCEQTIPAY